MKKLALLVSLLFYPLPAPLLLLPSLPLCHRGCNATKFFFIFLHIIPTLS